MPWWLQGLSELHTYQPPWTIWFFLVAVLVGVSPVAWHRFSPEGAKYREAYLDRREFQQRMENLNAEQYQPVFEYPEADTQTSTPVEIRARPRQQLDDGTITQEAALIYKDRITRFAYVVSARAVWMIGRDDVFEGPDEDGTPIDEGLRRDYVQKLVNESDRVVCIGLASSERGPDNSRLADNRAFHLCRALYNIGFVDPERQIVRGVSLGEAQLGEDEVAVSTQRSVVLVGIYNSRRIPRAEDVLSALEHLVQVEGVRMASYRRTSGGRRLYFTAIGPGPYDGAPTDTTPLAEGQNPFE